MSPLGILTGMPVEANIARSALSKAKGDGLIEFADADVDLARARTLQLIESGASTLMSFGIAGGLSSDVKTGDLIIPTKIIAPDGTCFNTDFIWQKKVCRILAEAGVPYHEGAMLGSNSAVAEADEKKLLAVQHQALAVDMESHVVAEIAAQAGTSLRVVRAVADNANDTLPPAALAAMTESGFVAQATKVTRHLFSHPGELPQLLKLARNTQAALSALKRATALCPNILLV